MQLLVGAATFDAMEEHPAPQGYVIDKANLPARFPTHAHAAGFWECLGRAVATFGFLEETLARAIFALTGSRHPTGDEAAIKAAVDSWLVDLEVTLKEQLHDLIVRFDEAVEHHPQSKFEPASRSDLVKALQEARKHRNAICHASWGVPDEHGASRMFHNRNPQTVPSPIDCAYLEQLQRHTMELACEVMNAVTHMGYRFPGSSGPGRPLSVT